MSLVATSNSLDQAEDSVFKIFVAHALGCQFQAVLMVATAKSSSKGLLSEAACVFVKDSTKHMSDCMYSVGFDVALVMANFKYALVDADAQGMQ